jgi:adenylate kinase
MATNIVLLGPLGSGKGTQVKGILEYFEPKCQFYYFELGAIFREVIAKDTELGKKVKGYVQRGILVPNEIVIETFVEHLACMNDACGVVWDGIPRNMVQAKVFDQLLAEKGDKVDLVLHLDLPEDRVVERIMGRRTCKNCGRKYHMIHDPPKMQGVCDACGGELLQRTDDSKEEPIRERYGWFVKEIVPIIEHYKGRGVLETINGCQVIPRVAFEIKRVLKKKFPLE